MWFKKKNLARFNNLSLKEFCLSVGLSVFVFAVNLYLVWLMNKDSVAITYLLLICFSLSAIWRLAECRDKEGWFLVIVPLSDFATVILALACVSTIADADFKPIMMKSALNILAGFVCGVYGFSLCRVILSIEYDKSKRT